MGGEPLHKNNIKDVALLIHTVRCYCPGVLIYIWTGFTYEELKEYRSKWISDSLDLILNETDYLIDGPYKQEERDITLAMRGSRNQRIINLKNGEIISIIK
jgi:anaerobic ribonucleoside-triphosphate reductase activating protein